MSAQVAAETGEALPSPTYIGGGMLDWGCHAVDYMRYMTRMNIINAQAYYHHPPEYDSPLAASINPTSAARSPPTKSERLTWGLSRQANRATLEARSNEIFASCI